MNRRPIILIAGWGYPASVMSGLGDALKPDLRLIAVSTHDLALRGNFPPAADKDAAAECRGYRKIVRKCSRPTMARRSFPAKAAQLGRLKSFPASEPDSTEGMSSYADGLASLIREQGEAATLMGWSLGGLVALETASRYPEKVGRLVLVSTTPKFCSSDGYACGMPLANVRAMSLGLKRDPAKTLAGFYQLAAAPFAEPVAAIREHGRQAADWTDELTLGLSYLMTTDLRERLHRIQAPVLMLHGREDRVIPWQAADLANRGLPESRLCLYDGLGHDLPLREPKRLVMEIRRFLS